MNRSIVILNIVALAAALGFFIWSNFFQEERDVLVAGEGGRIDSALLGGGWPVPPSRRHPVIGESLQVRRNAWIVNGPVGFLFLAALIANVFLLTRERLPSESRHLQQRESESS